MSKEEMNSYLERKAEQYCRQHAFALTAVFVITNEAITLDLDMDAFTAAADALTA